MTKYVLSFVIAFSVHAAAGERNCAALAGDLGSVGDVALERLRDKLPGTWDTIHGTRPPQDADYGRILYLAVETASLASEEYAIRAAGKSVYITGGDSRGVLYGVYEYVEEAVFRGPLPELNVRRRPLVPKRYAWATPYRFGGTVSSQRLFWQKTLPELPKLGINGIFVIAYYQYPGAINLPPWEQKDGKYAISSHELAEYRLMVREFKRRGLDVCLAVATVTPPEYSAWQVKLHYAGLQKFERLEDRIQDHFRHYLQTIHDLLPEVDSYILSANEGLRPGAAGREERGVNPFIIDDQYFRYSHRNPAVSERVLA